ncbi:inhibitor of Bruton tyrosine kinase [Anabrus simplex]|uniref:inhibitor of Bruton tyrosine kinase n=1 Tax=Anabrus simplex TaxID=316456 RepID=UPI0035A27E50
MMSGIRVPPSEAECSHRCRSRQHGAALASVLTLRGIRASALIAYLKWLCGNCGQVADLYGRTALHSAASCGWREIVHWLVKHGDANVNARDMESGYTPLHRSIFYGQIHVAASLMQLGANMGIVDYDDLTAIDHVMKDRLPFVEYSLSNPCEVYVWGTNTNYTLGIGTQHSRLQPELLDSFRKQGISVKQVAMHKFHSVFLTHDGRVFSCGHGQGGRLGLDSEKAVLTPHQMKLGHQAGSGLPEICSTVSVGRDHTVLLMESGAVMTCGLNAHHQLGHTPPPSFLLSPRSILHKSIKSVGTVLGVHAARFHTVIWGSKAILTFGLHAGQLGYPKGPESTQITPKVVSTLSHKDHEITHVVASDGATVVAVKKGDIYVLHQYQCRKIASKQLDVVKVAVVGGHLDSKVDNSILMDQKGEQLKVAVLTSTGKLLLWQESTQQLTRCLFNLNRPLMVTDVAINRSQLLLVTQDGEAFEGELKARKVKKHSQQPQQELGQPFHEFLDREDCEMVKVKRLPHIHRAVKISSDLKGRNFAVLQTHPKAALLEVPLVETSDMKDQMLTLLQEAHPQDIIHDVIFQVGLREFAAHNYIIASRSEPLAKLIREQRTRSTSSKNSIPRVKIGKICPEIFEQVLQFIYTNDCALLRPGACPVNVENSYLNENGDQMGGEISDPGLENIISEDLNSVSAFEVYSEVANGRKSKNKQANQQSSVCDPVRLAQEAAKRFAVSNLRKKLEGVRYENGFIVAKGGGSYQPAKQSFDLKKHQDLYDVSVKSEEGQEIRGHKCILAARLEYLNNMLSHGWVDTSENVTLRLPVPYNILEMLLEFLYQDECRAVQTSEDIGMVCQTLIIADQLFMKRLKEICEVALSGMLTLRNATEMLQFADTYNAAQLKQCCMQYVCLNLCALLESRALDILNEDLLEDLSKYYRELNPRFCKRVITPYTDAPSQSIVEEVADAYPVYWEDDKDADLTENSSKRSAKTGRRKPRPRKISSTELNKENQRVRYESTSSNISYNSDDAEISKNLHCLSFEDLTEKCNKDGKPLQEVTLTLSEIHASNSVTSPNSVSSWVKVAGGGKNQKIVQARLKAISAAKETPSLIDSEVDSFVRLSPKRSAAIKCPSPSQPSGSQRQVEMSDATHQNEIEPATSPPDLVLDFPELQRSPPVHQDGFASTRIPHKTSEGKKLVKISQKQRKKMAAEINSGSLGDQLEQLNQQSRSVWGQQPVEISNSVEAAHNFSLMDVMQAEIRRKKHNSSPIEIQRKPSSSPPATNPWFKCQAASPASPKQACEGTVSFMDIVADEKKQRDNWTKMRAKPLELTQLEDRAIEDLLVFYNAAGATDERITVRRVMKGIVATPTWITSHH